MPALSLLDKEMAEMEGMAIQQAVAEGDTGKMCWACGQPCQATKWREAKRCSRCPQFATTARFCSETCLKAYWLRHEKWHALKDAKAARARSLAQAKMQQQETRNVWVRQATEKKAQAKVEYARLVALQYVALFIFSNVLNVCQIVTTTRIKQPTTLRH